MELTKHTENNALAKCEAVSELVQLRDFKGETVYMKDPEGKSIEFKVAEDGTRLTCTKDENGKCMAIEERDNGTKIYHISSDSTGLPSSHEVRADQTEIIYFYDQSGKLQHFVELKTNGDRISTILEDNGSIYSIEQKQIGGVVFQAWLRDEQPKEGMVWLHPDGEISTHGDNDVVDALTKKFARFLDGVHA